jgi:hypothetical protein
MTDQYALPHTVHHWAEILQRVLCGRFHCLCFLPPREIEEWVDEGQTTLCPYWAQHWKWK